MELFLCLDGLAVAEGYVDVALAVYREIVGQGIEVVEGELGQLFRHLLEGGQVVILFLVCLLVEGDVGVFVDVLLDGIGDDLRLVQQLVPLGLKLRGGKEQYHHLESVSDDRVLCSQQLVCRRQERILNLLVGQVRSGAALVAVEFVITLPDDSAVLVGRVPDL